MTAKEMFEKLGYHFVKDEEQNYIAYERNGYDADYFICFELEKKYYQCFYNTEYTMYSQPLEVNMQLQNAINKQIEELGWNNETTI